MLNIRLKIIKAFLNDYNQNNRLYLQTHQNFDDNLNLMNLTETNTLNKESLN